LRAHAPISYGALIPAWDFRAETFNDPFVSFDGVHNQTQWWQTSFGLCQDNLEVGDVIEGFPDPTVLTAPASSLGLGCGAVTTASSPAR